jgi:hypothetical protein
MSRAMSGASSRLLKTGRGRAPKRHTSLSFHQPRLNSDACSGTALLRGLLRPRDSGRCPKIRTELPARASSTRSKGLALVPAKAVGVSIKETSPFDPEVAGNNS